MRPDLTQFVVYVSVDSDGQFDTTTKDAWIKQRATRNGSLFSFFITKSTKILSLRKAHENRCVVV